MTEPIFDSLIHHGTSDIDAIRRVWHDITGSRQRQPYHPSSSNPPKETPAMSTATLRADLDEFLTKAETDAAKVAKYEAEPMVQMVVEALEAIPEARAILTPVLAGVSKLASMAPVPPAAPVEAANPQIETGVAS